MGIDIGIAMTWEVLGHCHHSSVLQAFAIGYDLLRHTVWVFTKGTDIDDGVIGVDIYIGNGGKVDGDAHEATFASHLLAIFVEQAVVRDIAQYAVLRECG